MKWAGNTPLTNGTCRRSFTVDYFTACLPRTLLQFSLLRRRLSHCAVRVALIWFLARLALCFAFGVSFAVISPLSCSLSLSILFPLRIQPLRIARKSLWLIVVIDGRVRLPFLSLSLPRSLPLGKPLIMSNPHNGRFVFQISKGHLARNRRTCSTRN